ncbi:Fe-S cluster assembly protein IscX [Streptomyces aureoversilis]|uniref:Fe-S cluster assembly protein IscX n=1 Tax=Streptomyces aureoversilis TaxID=67277 RepID=A0ABV9ZPV3_9ACTN
MPFTDLHRRVLELDGFDDDPKRWGEDPRSHSDRLDRRGQRRWLRACR